MNTIHLQRKVSVLFATAIIGCAVPSPRTWAQAAPSPTDTAFETLLVAARPLPIPPLAPGQQMTRDVFLRNQKAQSAAFVAAAKMAHDFYTNNASDGRVTQAKKIEVLSLLKADDTGSSEVEPEALRLARQYRSDNANASSDRFAVAMAVTHLQIERERIRDHTALMKEYLSRANDLYGEFPNEPAMYDLYIGIARNGDDDTARTVAKQVLGMPAPDNIKQQAQAVIDRLDMPGKPIHLEWQDQSGKFYNSADLKGKVLVFYVWATWAGGATTQAQPLGQLPANTMLVSVNVDTDVAKGKDATSKAPFAGITYVDDRGLDGPLPRELKASKVPAVHVVDANGVYVGSGPIAQLTTLLAKAGQ